MNSTEVLLDFEGLGSNLYRLVGILCQPWGYIIGFLPSGLAFTGAFMTSIPASDDWTFQIS